MTTHRERIEQAEREVVERAVEQANVWTGGRGDFNEAAHGTNEAAYALLALRASCCPECGGTGVRFPLIADGFGYAQNCPAGCDNGRAATKKGGRK